MVVDRPNQCENIMTLAKELGVSRRLLYVWREKLEPTVSGAGPPANAREAMVRKEVSQLKRVLAEKVLEVDFFKGALPAARPQRTRRLNRTSFSPPPELPRPLDHRGVRRRETSN